MDGEQRVKIAYKTCCRCRRSKSSADFNRNSSKRDGLAPQCKECSAAYGKVWYQKNRKHKAELQRKWAQKNRDKINARRRDFFKYNNIKLRARQKRYYKNLKLDMIAAYGGQCVCCGIKAPEFLSINHKDGKGHEERKKLYGSGQCGAGVAFYARLKKRGWPKDNYELMCYNCNCSNGFFGYCPHRGKP